MKKSRLLGVVCSHTITLSYCFVLLLFSSSAFAAFVTTYITAEVVSINGTQVPTNLVVNDTVHFTYEYDNAGVEANLYYLNGTVQTVPISTYPHLSTLSDALVTFSPNLLELFSEFTGTSGYQNYNSHWVWTENNILRFHDSISPSTRIIMGHELLDPKTTNGSGSISLWQSGQTGTTNVILNFLEYSTVPIPPALWLFGSGLIGLIGIARRKS